MIQVLDRLFSTIVARRNGDPTKSHTAALFQKGRGHIARKVGEEATETIVAAMEGNRTAVISESADVLFHLMVLWADQGIAPADVWAELERREGTSGVAEKASRKS